MSAVPVPPLKIEPKDTREIKLLKHKSPLVGCRFDPTGEYVFVSAQDNTIQRWHLETGKATPLVGHKSWVRALTFDASRNTLYTGDYAGKILAWPIDAETPKPTKTIDAHKGWVRALAVRPGAKELASCGNDGRIRLWSLPDGKLVRTLDGHESHVYYLAYHPSSPQLVSVDHKGNLHTWDLAKGTLDRKLDASILHKYDPTFCADIGGMRGLTFSPDGKTLIGGGISNVSNAFAGVGEPLIVQFDWADGKRTLHKPKQKFRGTIWGLVWHPLGYIIAAGGGNGGAMWFWKPSDEKDIHTLKLPTNARDLDMHPDGKRLAVAYYDGSVRLYDMTPKPPAPKKPPVKKPTAKKK